MLIREKHLLIAIIASILILSLGLMSCSRLLPDSDLGEYKVPDTYTTYTDKNRFFSISYPSDWNIRLPLSAWEDESDSFKECLNGNDSPNGLLPKWVWKLFMAVKKYENNNNSAYIIVSAAAPVKHFPQRLTKEQIYNLVMDTKDYKPFFQETLRIAGNEVTILKVPNTGEAISIASVLIVDDIVWGVTGFSDGQYAKDIQTIIRSLRIFE